MRSDSISDMVNIDICFNAILNYVVHLKQQIVGRRVASAVGGNLPGARPGPPAHNATKDELIQNITINKTQHTTHSDQQNDKHKHTEHNKTTGQGHQLTYKLRCLAFSPGGALLATGSDDGTMRLWSPQPHTRYDPKP